VLSLHRKIAIVTGASRGIGREIAFRLAADGACVVLTGRDATLLERSVVDIRTQGGQATSIELDLRVEAAASKLAAFTKETFGGIDIVIHCAGSTKRGSFFELTEDEWSEGFAVKFRGAVRVIRAAWPELALRGGSVVNIVGIAARTPGADFCIGSSVNAALLALTKALAEQGLRDGVQVNAVNPGPVRTGRWTARVLEEARRQGVTQEKAEATIMKDRSITRVGEPRDVANLVAYIVSDHGRLLHGSIIDLDGGATKAI
jgi:3-oxoacyl-[acyl-carrier protein] reductase